VDSGQRDHVPEGGHEDVRKVIENVDHHPTVVGFVLLGYLQLIHIVVVNLSEFDVASDPSSAAFAFATG